MKLLKDFDLFNNCPIVGKGWRNIEEYTCPYINIESSSTRGYLLDSGYFELTIRLILII